MVLVFPCCAVYSNLYLVNVPDQVDGVNPTQVFERVVLIVFMDVRMSAMLNLFMLLVSGKKVLVIWFMISWELGQL